ncbi:hypothetical protein FRC19_004456 [Serendipita sp. 401]|nr:hypothetical protein FRC19_004456 [Serendipita sp. 401]
MLGWSNSLSTFISPHTLLSFPLTFFFGITLSATSLVSPGLTPCAARPIILPEFEDLMLASATFWSVVNGGLALVKDKDALLLQRDLVAVDSVGVLDPSSPAVIVAGFVHVALMTFPKVPLPNSSCNV